MLPLMGRDLCVEVKARADGFRELYCWLKERDTLIVKADRRSRLSSCGYLWLRKLPSWEMHRRVSAKRTGHQDEPPHYFGGMLAPPNDAELAAAYCGEPTAMPF